MSIVSYGGVVLPYCQITRFDQKALADESDTDLVYQRFEVEASCVINADYMALIAPDLVHTPAGTPFTDNAAAIMEVIRTRLLRRRRKLSIKFNGVELMPATQQGLNARSEVDARNGPIPQSCTITALTNTTFILHYHIIAHYWENKIGLLGQDAMGVNKLGNPIISNRWGESQDIVNNYVTVRRSGKVIIRSDNVIGALADSLRAVFATTGLPDGFIRKSSRYTVDPSGLALQYDIVDEEQYRMPPRPAFEAEGHYVETTTIQGGWRIAEAMVKLKGDKLTSQSVLINVAIFTVLSKLFDRGEDSSVGSWQTLMQAILRQNLYKNEVDFSCTFRRGGTPATTKGGMILSGAGGAQQVKFALNAFGNLGTGLSTSDTDLEYKPAHLPYGTSNGLLQAAAYYDPSLFNRLDIGTNQMIAGQPVGTAGIVPEV